MLRQTPKLPDIEKIVREWLSSRRRNNRLSRNTIAVGIVVLGHLIEKCPTDVRELFSEGGELRGSRSGLQRTLQKHGIPPRFLKEATTRQAHQDARILAEGLEFGKQLARCEQDVRIRLLNKGLDILRAEASSWLNRQPIRVNCDRAKSPGVWVSSILEKAKGRSGGVVEQHIVGAKLQTRLPTRNVPNHPSHAGDHQTGRSGDFTLGKISYHVTATDGKEAIRRCTENIESGIFPVLLVPRQFVLKAGVHAENAGVQDRMSVLSLEDFITQNILELSSAENDDFFATLKTIVDEYNRRLEEVETDMSLKIELS